MPEPIVYYYIATRHDGSQEIDLEFTDVFEHETDFVGKLEKGGERFFPKTEWKSVSYSGHFRPFMP